MFDSNKDLLRQYIEEVWHKGNPQALEQFLAPNYKRHRSPTQPSLARDQQKELLLAFRESFPDIQITVEDMISDGDRIAFRSTMRGTHQSVFFGLAPTGKQVVFSLLDIIRVKDGKFVEQWGGPDIYDLLQQLGASLVSAPENNQSS